MSWIKTIPEIDLPEGARRVISMQGADVLLLHHEGRIYAVANACPHMRFALKGGRIADGAIVCPFHHSAFDLETGDVKAWSPWPPLVGPMLGNISREKALTTYTVKVEEGYIFIEQKQVKAVL